MSKDMINIGNSIAFRCEKNHYFCLTLFTHLNASFMHHLNNPVKAFFQKHGYSFIDNSNVSSENFWLDGLHLNNSGKGF